MRFHLVDSITAWHPGARAEGIKALARTDAYIEQSSVMPRTLLIESMAQLASFLLGDAEARDGRRVLSLLTSVDRLTWHDDLHPGERANFDVTIVSRRPEGARVAVSARVGDRLLADGGLGYVFFAATSPAQAAEFDWTYELLLQLSQECREGEPPRREAYV